VGQKTHPEGFRLVTVANHLSKWYATKIEYSKKIEEDYFIRSKINTFFNEFLIISKIKINRINTLNNEHVEIIINSLFPREKDILKKIKIYLNKDFKLKSLLKINNFLLTNIIKFLFIKKNFKLFVIFVLKIFIKNFLSFLQKKTKKNYSIHFNFIKNQFLDSALIGKFVENQLEARIPFRRIIKLIFQKIKIHDKIIKGIKIQISGRLNGIDMARTEWKRLGMIPLHTLMSKIDFTQQIAKTIYGIIGIKIWLLK
jgi:small subunit ribosomal protein S3